MIPKKPTFLVVTLLWLEELTAKTSKNTVCTPSFFKIIAER